MISSLYFIFSFSVYPVTSFGGRKTFILANASWLGGKNPTLGIICLITGSIHICLGIAFLIVHFVYGKRSDPEGSRTTSGDAVLWKPITND
ncbi:unnamed protein product [Schistosoma curassoni]|uniref:Uncharacterized protein n=1 Tax=Schistosoma curassoni TaxID=6186 RepID=A0A3P8G346_9TREM|nr:unnamed protein product [Schistosoma curassoni]